MKERTTLKVNSSGFLEIGGCSTVDLVSKFKTPLYVLDEEYVRLMMKTFKNSLAKYKGESLVLYASKAFSCKAIYAIAKSEGIGVDVVSGGELYTALSVGFPAEKIFMHGNNKLPQELAFAIENDVGAIVVDSYDEACIINDICNNLDKKQCVLIRINPGVEAHTHAFVQTARTDSKFGFSIADGTAFEITEKVLQLPNLILQGYHCHIGSQIFERQSFALAAKKMVNFVKLVKEKFDMDTKILNLGGGFGICYTDDDPDFTQKDYEEYVDLLVKTVEDEIVNNNLILPKLIIEPGRSIVGEAGITLYTVGAVKEIPSVKTYVAIDGGMFDNPRYALYQSKYSIVKANDVNAKCTQLVSIAGKCCESGDLIAVDVALPQVNRGDIIAVLATGAYNYSMSSNYNRNLIPPVVMVKDGKADYIVEPQSFEDLVRNDALPEHLRNV